jgi:hypothetical protein
MTTHRLIQIAALLDNLEGLPNLYRRCAVKLAGIGNRNGAIAYTSRAQKADRVLMRVRERLARIESADLFVARGAR